MSRATQYSSSRFEDHLPADYAFHLGYGEEVVVTRRPPRKAIALAIGLLIFGGCTLVFGLVIFFENIVYKKHGIALLLVGVLMFLPGLYYTVIAYKAWKHVPGYSFAALPDV